MSAPLTTIAVALSAARNGHGCCRFCGMALQDVLVDLGTMPLANAYVESEDLGQPEPLYPLRAFVCRNCFLVQLEEWATPDRIFADYAYFSSYSDSWLHHSRVYAGTVIERFGLDARSQVVEVASNDGYLLQYFVERGIPVLGIEPARNVAAVAISKGIATRTEFFGQDLAERLAAEGVRADLLIGNNVLAHVPQLNDFVRGLALLLAPTGVITMEFPHLLRLTAENQFDTIYHEHFSYFSLLTVERIFAAHGLTLFDVEELPTHGGSLRIYARHPDDNSKPVTARVAALRASEAAAGLERLEYYRSFDKRVRATKRALVSFVNAARREGRTIAAYGAPAKGNVLLNYCGIGADLIDYTVDRNPRKQGRFLPGTRIPIKHPDAIERTRPDFLLILPWNLREEIMEQMACIRAWGGRFVVPIPEVRVLP